MPITEKDLIYKLWLNLRLNHDHFKIDKAIRLFDSAEDIYRAKTFDKRKVFNLGLGSLFAFNNKDLDDAKKIIEDCEKLGIEMLTMDDTRYPQRLRQITGHPSVLYVKGKLPDIDNLVAIAMVGTRRCSSYGAGIAHKLAFQLSKCGVLVVSGMAEGIDGAAHKGALDAGRPTLAVLAGGVDNIYPAMHRDLYNKILTDGAVIAEEPPGSRPKPASFPIRNRIIAGLCMGTVIVEGRRSSGARHTAKYAEEYNRDVFAVPHNANTSVGELPNYLIKNGAKLTADALDVLVEYMNEYPDMLANNIEKYIVPEYDFVERNVGRGDLGASSKKTPRRPGGSSGSVGTKSAASKKPQILNAEEIPRYKELNNTEQVIVKYIYTQSDDVGGTHIDDIIRKSGVDVTAVNSTVLLLQMKGVVTELPGKNYKLTCMM